MVVWKLFSLGSPDAAVQETEQRYSRGPPDAMVIGLEVFPSNDDPGTGLSGNQQSENPTPKEIIVCFLSQ
ncbi:hypothetical protein SLEP1_g55235 [Rubroshorea leprosula]|uniref:Uncharacterized protein n=1 Tax=Rubroshorea leprosula TaxID=152421 RepID=A0AAV5MGX4_9ROSI|nr:hypothetical protein SLEP1_g55235 [Rubroshorea leprosula]